ncbi:MAG: hypothetical protein EZS28_055688, partial [Streblomastix strix]
FWAQRSYTLRYIGLRADGTHHRGFGEGLLNVSTFIQRHARHEHLTVNDWKAFWRELDTDLYLDTVRMELDEDDNHHHHHDHDHDHNHRHDRERNDRDNQLDLGRGRKRRRVISSEGSGNGQNNDDWAVRKFGIGNGTFFIEVGRDLVRYAKGFFLNCSETWHVNWCS